MSNIRVAFKKFVNAYQKIGFPLGETLWSIWGTFIVIFGAGIIGYILISLANILYVSLSILFYCIVMILIWIILTLSNLREEAHDVRFDNLEKEVTNITSEVLNRLE